MNGRRSVRPFTSVILEQKVLKTTISDVVLGTVPSFCGSFPVTKGVVGKWLTVSEKGSRVLYNCNRVFWVDREDYWVERSSVPSIRSNER